ncbi:MAG: hypothetical protein ACTSVZ_03055 [Promethearchaeota archaeon]
MSKPLNQKLLRALIFIVLGLFVLTITFAWIYYPDPYKFFQYFVSELGSNTTKLGTDNTISKYIFGIGLLSCGFLSLVMAMIYFIRSQKSILNILKGLTLLTVSVGAYGVMNPYDLIQNSLIHPLGATLFVFGLDIYTFFCQFLRWKNRKISLDTEENKKVAFNKYFVFVIFAVSLKYLIFALMEWDLLLPATQKVLLIVVFLGIAMLDLEDF